MKFHGEAFTLTIPHHECDPGKYLNCHVELCRARAHPKHLGQIVNTTFGIADATVSTGVKAQDIVDGAKALNQKQIIGGLVKVLDSVVKVGDDISAVHHDTLPQF